VNSNRRRFIQKIKVALDARTMKLPVTRIAQIPFILLSLFSAYGFAGTVTFPNNFSTIPDLSFAASFAVPRNAPVGTVLQSASQAVGLAANGVTCNVRKDIVVSGTPVPGDASTFQTNVPRIGVRLYVTGYWNSSWAQAPEVETLSPTSDGAKGHYTRADLVVTGPVGSGSLANLPVMTVTFTGDWISTVSGTQRRIAGSVITGGTCNVVTPAVEMALPKEFVGDLSAAGSTAGAAPLSIGLDCAKGVKVYLTISDASNVANRSTRLGLAPGSSASGVGVQILNGSTPVAYGPDSAVAGTTNQWFAGSASGGQMQVPLTARYVRTTGPLIPGTVRATATFTVSYQ
jgi:type 1 fimbria pilin